MFNLGQFQTIFLAALLAIWLPLSVFHVRKLQTQIESLSRMADTAPSSLYRAANQPQLTLSKTDTNQEMQDITGRKKYLRALSLLCRQRLRNAAIMSLMGLAYIGILLIPSTQGIDAIASPSLYRIFIAGCFSIFSFFGLSVVPLFLLHFLWIPSIRTDQ